MTSTPSVPSAGASTEIGVTPTRMWTCAQSRRGDELDTALVGLAPHETVTIH